MSRRVKVLIVVAVLVAIAGTALQFGRYENQYADRFNPLLEFSEDFVQIPAGSREVRDVLAVDLDGAAVPYRITFQAWGTDDTYGLIEHRGLYVRSFTPLAANAVPERARTALAAGR
ncbi:hypothetical protein ACFVMC_19545 [Nocardia sp. NPDC127579]|uniref:hypothetical protein n=1 Tax=Nocardia sp. NPDC127579 TaxID=3345402 RepID=UPI003640E6C0